MRQIPNSIHAHKKFVAFIFFHSLNVLADGLYSQYKRGVIIGRMAAADGGGGAHEESCDCSAMKPASRYNASSGRWRAFCCGCKDSLDGVRSNASHAVRLWGVAVVCENESPRGRISMRTPLGCITPPATA